jgi:hypothetical protein
LSPEQDTVVRAELARRRWTLQTLMEEALELYFREERRSFPVRVIDDEKAS